MSVKPRLTQKQTILYGGLIERAREPLLLHIIRTPNQMLHQTDGQICFPFATFKAMSANAFQFDRLGGNLGFKPAAESRSSPDSPQIHC